jgi:hypothetical protein
MLANRARKAAFVIASALGLWVVVIGLPPTLLLSPGDTANYQLLLKAKYFSGRAVGFLAVEPPEARAFVSLAGHRGGGTAFKYLLFRGTPAAKIYALVGLRRTNPAFFSVAVQVFRFWPGEVETFFGCIIQKEPIATVVATDKPGAVRLKHGETLVDWWRRRMPGVEVSLDVIGGGYTSMFFDWDQLARPAA